MRILATGFLTLCIILALARTARAELLTAVRPGVMCVSAGALAALTLHDGGSRSAAAGASPRYKQLAQAGGCVDIRKGMVVDARSIRKNTSIVAYDSPDGSESGIFYAPNIDFVPAAPPHTVFYKEIRRKCPEKLDAIYAYDRSHLIDMQSLFIATLPRPMQKRIAAIVQRRCEGNERCAYRDVARQERRLHLEARHADFLCALQGFPAAGADPDYP